MDAANELRIFGLALVADMADTTFGQGIPVTSPSAIQAKEITNGCGKRASY